jgi:hypothetical protein
MAGLDKKRSGRSQAGSRRLKHLVSAKIVCDSKKYVTVEHAETASDQNVTLRSLRTPRLKPSGYLKFSSTPAIYPEIVRQANKGGLDKIPVERYADKIEGRRTVMGGPSFDFLAVYVSEGIQTPGRSDRFESAKYQLQSGDQEDQCQ